jgi:hypothetical protein
MTVTNPLLIVILLSSRPLSTNVKVKMYKTIILPVVCIGVKLGLSR